MVFPFGNIPLTNGIIRIETPLFVKCNCFCRKRWCVFTASVNFTIPQKSMVLFFFIKITVGVATSYSKGFVQTKRLCVGAILYTCVVRTLCRMNRNHNAAFVGLLDQLWIQFKSKRVYCRGWTVIILCVLVHPSVYLYNVFTQATFFHPLTELFTPKGNSRTVNIDPVYLRWSSRRSHDDALSPSWSMPALLSKNGKTVSLPADREIYREL